MEKMRPIQIIYAPGMFGKCVRWMFDRFTDGSNFAGIQSPWDEDNRVHGFVKSNSYNQKFKASHQLSAGEESYPDPSAYKVVLSFDKSDLLCNVQTSVPTENKMLRFSLRCRCIGICHPN